MDAVTNWMKKTPTSAAEKVPIWPSSRPDAHLMSRGHSGILYILRWSMVPNELAQLRQRRIFVNCIHSLREVGTLSEARLLEKSIHRARTCLRTAPDVG